MSFRAVCSVWLLWLLLSAAGWAQPDFSQAHLEEIVAELSQSLADEVQVKFPPPSVRVVSPDELQEILRAELEPQMMLQFEAGEARRNAARMASAYKRGLLGKFSRFDGAVLVVPENFERLKAVLGRPDISGEAMLRAVLLHELVHAFDEHRFGVVTRLGDAKTAEQLQVMDVLLEGHAQYLTERILRLQGKPELFADLEGVLLATPPGAEEGERFVLQLLSHSQRFAYREGHRFFRRMAELHPDKDLAAMLYAEPPVSRAIFLHPERYGQEVKVVEVVLEPLWTTLKEQRQGWRHRQVRLDEPALRAAFGDFVPEDKVIAELRHLVSAQTLLSISPRGDYLVLAVFESDGEASAERFLELNLELHRAKEERLTSGDFQILESIYTDLDLRGADRAVRADKQLLLKGNQTTGFDLLLRRGRFCVEILGIGFEPGAEVEASALAILDYLGSFTEAVQVPR